MENQQQVFGLCWYQPEQWARLLEISDDADKLEETYEEWRKSAHKVIQEFQATGKKINKVKINLEQLLFWCNDKGIPVNGSSRAEYVAYVLEQRNKEP